MKQVLSFITGAVCGAVVGAAVALLFTPISGPDIKRQSQERLDWIRSEMRQAYMDKQAELEAQLAAIKNQGEIDPLRDDLFL
jgi:gas vesicle protein